MRLHVIDGTYELFRNYYGAPGTATPEGREIGATRGLVRSLWSLLQQPDVTHIAIAFDSVIESFRNELFDGYKTGAGIDPDLLGQFPLAEQASTALGITTWRMLEFETDDAMATTAARFEEDDRVDQVVLCTPDKDMAQCVRGNRVVMLDRRRRVTLDSAGVVAKFGVPPVSIPDWLALVGDDADGIPGISGWGAVSAARVLSEYGHLEDIPHDPDSWPKYVRGSKRLAERLFPAFEQALLYRRLATLRCDVPLSEELEDLEWRGVDRDALRAFCELLEWPEFFARVAG